MDKYSWKMDNCSFMFNLLFEFANWFYLMLGETSNSIQPPERKCSSREFDKLCDQKTCSSCSSIREANSQTVRGTLLVRMALLIYSCIKFYLTFIFHHKQIPCRTAMRGSFPLNGTYFQVNEVNGTYIQLVQVLSFKHTISDQEVLKKYFLCRCLLTTNLALSQLKFRGLGYGICQDVQCTLEPLYKQYLEVNDYKDLVVILYSKSEYWHTLLYFRPINRKYSTLLLERYARTASSYLPGCFHYYE